MGNKKNRKYRKNKWKEQVRKKKRYDRKKKKDLLMIGMVLGFVVICMTSYVKAPETWMYYGDIFEDAGIVFHTQPTSSYNHTHTDLDHGGLVGLGDDDHSQYGAVGQAELVTSVWNFSDGLECYDNISFSGDAVIVSGSDSVFSCGVSGSPDCLEFEFNHGGDVFVKGTGIAQVYWLLSFQLAGGKHMSFGSVNQFKIANNPIGLIPRSQVMSTKLGSDDASGYLVFDEDADRAHANRAPSNYSLNPVFRIYSSDETEPNDYIEFYHNQSDAVIGAGNGNLIINTSDGDAVFYNDSGYGRIIYGDAVEMTTFYDKSKGSALGQYSDVDVYYSDKTDHFAHCQVEVTDYHNCSPKYINNTVCNETDCWPDMVETSDCGTKMVDGLCTNQRIATNEQAVYELIQEIQFLKDRIAVLEAK
jgi:hypothetical protein